MDSLDTSTRAEVTVLTPLSTPAKVSLPSAPVSIGRSSDCTIPIRDRYLSRKHAEIVPMGGLWLLKDCGSANGTYLNGSRVEADQPLHSGDRIRLGDSEIVFQSGRDLSSGSLSVRDSKVSATISIPYGDIIDTQPGATEDLERLRILNALATELIEDHPLEGLFAFIVDRVRDHLSPSRVAIALLTDDGDEIRSLELRRSDPHDTSELMISRTLLREIVAEKRVLAFVDAATDERLGFAKSIIMQGIRSAVAAPVMFGGTVQGILYLDFLQTQREISDEDVRLLGQVARLASMKLETTHLREEAIEKRVMDEELRTAAAIQRRLLPSRPPVVEGYTFAGSNRACRTVSGDYYDFVTRPDGRTWFVIGDVSGKGVTAALLMSSLQSAFRIFVKLDLTPAELTQRLNDALRETIPDSKFVTLVAGRLDPATGTIEFANAGHTPPIVVRQGGTEELRTTDLLLGLFEHASYRPQSLTLGPGDSLIVVTDGAVECADNDGTELGSDGLRRCLAETWGMGADGVAELIEESVLDHAGGRDDLGDDLTVIVLSRDRSAGATRASAPTR